MLNEGIGSEPTPWRLRRWVSRTRRTLALGTRLRSVLTLFHLRSGPAAKERIIPEPIQDIREGEVVRVRSREQIEKSLDVNGALKGCAIVEPMFAYCGQEVAIAKVVEKFFDEKEWRMRRCKNLVTLKDIHCDGSGHPDTMGCDRGCYFFWRTEWLERIQ
jgi:hypothetical protein